MKANEFFKKVGIDAVRSYLAAYEDGLTNNLKHLVESHELVESFSIIGLCAPENNYNQCVDYEKFGGLPMAKCELAKAIEYNSKFIEVILDNEITLIEIERLKQAILDVKSCQ